MNIFFFAHARTALWYGLQQLPLERGKMMLVPDYICEVILHPLEDLGIKAVFYPVDDQFAPDWDFIDKIQAKTPADAFLLVHYFGQPQDIERAKKFCDLHGIWFIEDNAHGHGGTLNGQPVGSFGDMGFSSPRKQLESASGGSLCLKTSHVENKQEVLPVYRVSRSKEIIRNIIRTFPRFKARLRRLIRPKPDYSDPLAFQEYRIGYFSADPHSLQSIFDENWNEHAESRRRNWLAWSEFATNKGLRPVWSEPHPESCPWVLPVYANSLNVRLDWFIKSRKHGFDFFPWPALPREVLLSSSIAIHRWQHLICIPLFQSPSRLLSKE